MADPYLAKLVFILLFITMLVITRTLRVISNPKLLPQVATRVSSHQHFVLDTFLCLHRYIITLLTNHCLTKLSLQQANPSPMSRLPTKDNINIKRVQSLVSKALRSLKDGISSSAFFIFGCLVRRVNVQYRVKLCFSPI